MFDRLFSYPAVLRRHCAGPLASERAAYLESLAARGAARGTLLRQARYCLCVARELQTWPRDHRFSVADLETLAASWAGGRVASGRAAAPRFPEEQFRSVAAHFVGALGLMIPAPVAPPGTYDDRVDDFVMVQRRERWASEATCQNRRWHIRRFLAYLELQDCALESVTPEHVDAYVQYAAQTWSRVSLRTTAIALRAWFRHCEARRWVRPGLAQAILVPRVYHHEGLPFGPTWDQVRRLVADADGDKPIQLRDRSLLLLLAVYGLRAGEVRRLRLEDIDWKKDQIRVVRSKSSRQDTLPLEPDVGNAIARYLRHGRPQSDRRSLFLTAKAPFGPLSGGAVYGLVERRLARIAPFKKGRGPHALRHACARHLVNAGLSFKQIGDHLGHRSSDATRIYAKVDLTSLRLVALEDLGGLA